MANDLTGGLKAFSAALAIGVACLFAWGTYAANETKEARQAAQDASDTTSTTTEYIAPTTTTTEPPPTTTTIPPDGPGIIYDYQGGMVIMGDDQTRIYVHTACGAPGQRIYAGRITDRSDGEVEPEVVFQVISDPNCIPPEG